MSRATIETICEATGLSRGTVSRALNNRNDINEQTKQRVVEACRRLKYRPSHAARSLATGRSCTVEVITHEIDSGFSIAFLRGVLSAAQESGFTVSVLELAREGEAAAQQLNGLETLPLDGLIFVGRIEHPLSGLSAEYLDSKPVVASHALRGFECDTRTPDAREAGRLAARLFTGGGVEQARYLFRSEDGTAVERAAGFVELCPEKLDYRSLAVNSDADLTDMLAELKGPIGIAAADDQTALAVMLACARIRRRPGVDLALLGCGNEGWTGRLTPALSSVDLGAGECGRWAFQTIQERASGLRTGKPQAASHAPTIVLRGTTACLKH